MLANAFFRSAEVVGEAEPFDRDRRARDTWLGRGRQRRYRSLLADQFQLPVDQLLVLAADLFQIPPQPLLDVQRVDLERRLEPGVLLPREFTEILLEQRDAMLE